MQATDHGDTEKSFLYLDQTKLLCDPIMILQTSITYKRIRHSPLFPKELLFSLFVNWGLNESRFGYFYLYYRYISDGHSYYYRYIHSA